MFKDVKVYISPIYPDKNHPQSKTMQKIDAPNGLTIPRRSFVKTNEFVVQEKFFKNIVQLYGSYKFLRAGAQDTVVF
jgi:hypothetical protein